MKSKSDTNETAAFSQNDALTNQAKASILLVVQAEIKDTLSPIIRESKGSRDILGGIKFWLRKERFEHPDGRTGAGKKWYPAESEGLDESAYRSPSHAYPWSYMHACRTAAHCAAMCKGDVRAVRKLARAIDKAKTHSELIAALPDIIRTIAFPTPKKFLLTAAIRGKVPGLTIFTEEAA
jgi:hypothetical protein